MLCGRGFIAPTGQHPTHEGIVGTEKLCPAYLALIVGALRMIIECDGCKARVKAEEIAYVEQREAFWIERVYLLQCPVCHKAIVAHCEDMPGEHGQRWSQPVRVYPEPGRAASLSEASGVPKVVIESFREAEKCIQVGAYLAAAAMAGRAVEGICRHFSTKGTYLCTGLRELRESGIIDARLYEWGEALRDERNKASHADNARLSPQDAEDILSFSYAIADYVFLLTKKFENYRKRKEKERFEPEVSGEPTE
jgi:hypothetical protein